MSTHRNMDRLSAEFLRQRVADLVSELVRNARYYQGHSIKDRRSSCHRDDSMRRSSEQLRAKAQAYMDSAREARRALRGGPLRTLTEQRRHEAVMRRLGIAEGKAVAA